MSYRTAQEAQREISHFLMHRYNWIRPHQFNGRGSNGGYLPPPHIHGRPRVAKLSICDGSMVEIALIHPDFRCGVAAVPDGIRWPSSQ